MTKEYKSAEQSGSDAGGFLETATVSAVRGRYLAARLYKRFENIILLTRLNRPIGIFLLLWPTLWAIWIASKGAPGWKIPLVFIAGVVLMRSAGCAINDFADRKFDSRVKRTRDRPLATGQAKPVTAIAIFIVCSAIAFLLVFYFLNRQVMYLSFVALAVAFAYPFMKRYTHLPQVILGVAFAMSVPMAFAAYLDTIPTDAWVMFFATVLWATSYDTMYALVDKDDDIKIGVKSTAILFADLYLRIIAMLHVMVIFAFLLIADINKIASLPFYLGLAFASIFSGYQLYLIYDRVPANCFKAFLNNNWYGASIFLGVFYHYMLEDGQPLSLWEWLLTAYIVSIIVVYNISLLKKANTAFWVCISCLLGPLALPLVFYAGRSKGRRD